MIPVGLVGEESISGVVVWKRSRICLRRRKRSRKDAGGRRSIPSLRSWRNYPRKTGAPHRWGKSRANDCLS
jgi:hypothetical protein